MEQVPGHQEGVPYNLREDFEHVRRAMADVEGESWLDHNRHIADQWDEVSEGERATSLEGARRWLETVPPGRPARYVVYGTNGVNRWYVYADGRVRFSLAHGTDVGLAKAREKGFWIE